MDLSNEAYNRVISDLHLVEISTAHCTKWMFLPPCLGLNNAVKEDINRKSVSEREKRHDFLMEWKKQKGPGATYKALIVALQRINCQNEAEYVSQLVLPLMTVSTQTETTSGVTTEAPATAVSASSKAGM